LYAYKAEVFSCMALQLPQSLAQEKYVYGVK
jgi:hypothetical protein